jgi:hypothetical protein
MLGVVWRDWKFETGRRARDVPDESSPQHPLMRRDPPLLVGFDPPGTTIIQMPQGYFGWVHASVAVHRSDRQLQQHQHRRALWMGGRSKQVTRWSLAV